MAYTTIDDPTINFNTKLYTANATSGTAITGVGFQPDWLWIKNRTSAYQHESFDSVRGATKRLLPSDSDSETTVSGVTSFDSDGFTLGDAYNSNKDSGNSIVSWCWKAGGTAPAVTYTVKVVSDSGNKYRFDDFGTSAVTLDLQEGGTYTFDQSDSSNSGHPLRFSTTSDGTHGGGSEYTTNVTTTGTAGSAGAKTVITVAASAPTLYYYCTQHSGMGGQANTNSTFGSSNFSGSVQTKVSANTTAGFSIVSYTGTGSVGTFGHGLGVKPNVTIQKKRSGSAAWTFYHDKVATDPATDYLYLSSNAAVADYADHYNDTEPTSSVFTLGTDTSINGSGATNIMYCFAKKQGYSSFGTYQGNGNADGTFVYTGFKPTWVLVKKTSASDSWGLLDTKRDTINPIGKTVFPDSTDSAEYDYNDVMDIVSNGFKFKSSVFNTNGSTYIYMAFAESPFVNSNKVPNNGR